MHDEHRDNEPAWSDETRYEVARTLSQKRQRMPMVKYVDLGCSDGKTVEDFLEGRSILPDLAKECRLVYAFDPFPHVREWGEIVARYPTKRIIFSERAASTVNGATKLAITENPEARTIVELNSNFDGAPQKSVVTFDFERWLRDHKLPGDTMIVKMDIEGAEFDILINLIESGAIHLIDHLYTEFHSWLMPEHYRAVEAEIRARCPIEIGAWY